MLLPPSDNNLSNQDKTPTRTSPRAPWVLILPLALAAGVLLQQSQNTTENTATNTTMNTLPQQFSLPSFIYVVGDDEKLHRKPWKASEGTTPVRVEDLDEIRVRWMNAVIEASPDVFPKQAKVQNVEIRSDAEAATVDVNEAFVQSDFWQGSTRTQLAIYAIVNTLSPVMAPKGRNVSVQFTVGGRPLQVLGEFDTSDPITPDMKMVAKTVNAR